MVCLGLEPCRPGLERNPVSDEHSDDWGDWGDPDDSQSDWQWVQNVIYWIRYLHTPPDPGFHVAVSIHGSPLSERQIDLLSILGYAIRLGGGTMAPHSPIVAARFVDLTTDGVTTMSEAVEYATAEISIVLNEGSQRIFAVHAMDEERWDECEQCRDDFGPHPAPDGTAPLLDDLRRWLGDDEFRAQTNATGLIAAAAAERIEALQDAGDALAEQMRSGSASGWDESIDRWDVAREGGSS